MLQYLGIVMIKQQGYEYLEKMVQRDARFGLHGALTKKKKYLRGTHMLFLLKQLVPKVNYCFCHCFHSYSSCMYNEV